MSDDSENDLKATLDELKTQHQALHTEIEELETQGGDTLLMQRLKREKLQVKDRISAIEDNILPDIIA